MFHAYYDNPHSPLLYKIKHYQNVLKTPQEKADEAKGWKKYLA